MYIETPGLVIINRPLHGFFVHLNRNEVEGRDELYILCDNAKSFDVSLDVNKGMTPLFFSLDDRLTVEEQVRKGLEAGSQFASNLGIGLKAKMDDYSVSDKSKVIASLLSLVLYLCSESPDWGASGIPQNPPAVRVKSGVRVFPVSQSRAWDVGVRLGAAMRAAQSHGSSESDGSYASPRAHLRCAHWHTYLVGAGRSKRILKWLPPIPVNIDYVDDLPSTIRPVKEG